MLAPIFVVSEKFLHHFLQSTTIQLKRQKAPSVMTT